MKINSKTRKLVYNKFNGKCAYCGSDIEFKNMQIDHLEPVKRLSVWNALNKQFEKTGKFENPQNDNFNNYMPSCRKCNHYKHSYTLEEFRKLMITLHERLEKHYINTVAVNFGMMKIKPFSGVFYFETVTKDVNQIELFKEGK